jgi:hypothetical protein
MQHYVIKFVGEHDEGQQFSMGSLVEDMFFIVICNVVFICVREYMWNKTGISLHDVPVPTSQSYIYHLASDNEIRSSFFKYLISANKTKEQW